MIHYVPNTELLFSPLPKVWGLQPLPFHSSTNSRRTAKPGARRPHIAPSLALDEFFSLPAPADAALNLRFFSRKPSCDMELHSILFVVKITSSLQLSVYFLAGKVATFAQTGLPPCLLFANRILVLGMVAISKVVIRTESRNSFKRRRKKSKTKLRVYL